MMQVDILVIGAGPAGYPCAFRAADLGLSVALVDERASLGGVCLHEGCIPSKAWLEPVKLIQEWRSYHARGLILGTEPRIDITAMRAWIQERVVARLGRGLSSLAKRRRVAVLQGRAELSTASSALVRLHSGETQRVQARCVVIATGSEPIVPRDVPQDSRIFTSTEAVYAPLTSGRILVVGAGVVGCELSCVFASFGLDVVMCDKADRVMPGMDSDLTGVVAQSLTQQGIQLRLQTAYKSLTSSEEGVWVVFDDANQTRECYDGVLLALGRRPRIHGLGLENIGLGCEEGKISVNERFETSVSGVYAVGDVAGGHLAHEASAQGRLCAEIIAGKERACDIRSMPSVAYTYPELAWVGMSEPEAREAGVRYRSQLLEWGANGRAVASLKEQGLTKLLIDDEGRLIGGGCVGIGASELIAELALAIEMHVAVDDLALTVHPHPTLSETIALAAEILEGSATDQ